MSNLNGVPWNSSASIQEQLINELLSENTELSWASSKSGLPEERAWTLQSTQKYSWCYGTRLSWRHAEQGACITFFFFSTFLSPDCPSSWSTDSSKRLHLEKHWKQGVSAYVWKVSSCNQWKKQQSSSRPQLYNRTPKDSFPQGNNSQIKPGPSIFKNFIQ